MKKLIGLALSLIILVGVMVGCGEEKNRILYSSANLSKCVELGDYKNIPVDTGSDEIKDLYEEVIKNDTINNGFHGEQINEGTVSNYDIVNIDYVGKKNGVAFDGGTDEDYDLTIGSGTFISGFEEGLIGVDIGATVDLNLTFPENYHSADLAGQAVVFTVTVNHVKPAKKPAEYYSKLGYKSLEEYEKEVSQQAVKSYLLDAVIANSKINKYPEEDLEFLTQAMKKTVENNLKQEYGFDLETYLGYVGQTEEEFNEALVSEQVKPLMETQMVLYAILDKEGMKVEQKDIEKLLDDVVKNYNNSEVTADELKDFYGEYYFEAFAVNEKVVDFIYDNAKIS